MKIESTRHQLFGKMVVPGSKSHTIRACLFAALADGTSIIRNPLRSMDCFSVLNVLRNFGVKIKTLENDWLIEGIGPIWPQPGFVIDCGNSGTLLYLITGILATINGYSVVTGDLSICSRPIGDELKALAILGAEAFCTREGTGFCPAIIRGPIKAGTTHLKGNLSQHVSGLMIAAALTSGTTRIILDDPKEIPFIKMTIRWLENAGVDVQYDERTFKWFEIMGANKLNNFDKQIPSDWSSVSFPLAAGVITGSFVTIEKVDTSKTQGDEAIVDILRNMGAQIEVNRHAATVSVGKSHVPLKPVKVNLSNFPDALPMIAVVAAFASGVSEFTGLGVCRLKETDRIALICKELIKLGVKVEEGADFIKIYGRGGDCLKGAECESYNDHRIAMALAVCGLALPKGERIVINQAECADVSFPDFYKTMNIIGAGFKEI